MNFKRRHHHKYRPTSDYSYPQLQKGDERRARANTRRRLESAVNKMKEIFS